MSDFLLECLLADAVLLNEWGARLETGLPEACAQEAPTARSKDASSRPPPSTAPSRNQANALEDDTSARETRDDLRRRKRESMQRSRQKRRNDTESMRVTLQTLSLQFERLREQQHRTSDSSAHPHPLNRRLSIMHSDVDFGTLAETSHQLKAEKLQLQRMLMEREMAVLRLADAVKSFTMAAMLKDEQRLALPLQEPAAQYFEYTDFSSEQIQAAISSCYLRIMQHERTARPLAHWVVGVNEEYQSFGWTVSCDISTGSNFFLSMAKQLSRASPQEVWQRYWEATARPTESSFLSLRRVVRLEVLQSLDDSVHILGADVHHPTKPGVRMRTIFMCFRLATERGFAVGATTMNPTSPQVRRLALPDVEYVDSSSWHDFVSDDAGTGCVVSIKSLSQYNTNENLRLRFMNALCLTKRLESEVMRNPVRLLD